MQRIKINDKQYQRKYYQDNRNWILEKKKIYNQKNKEHIAEYHKNYYLIHNEELKRKFKEYHHRKSKIALSQM